MGWNNGRASPVEIGGKPLWYLLTVCDVPGRDALSAGKVPLGGR
jgi:hypothetical protein